MYVLIQFEVGVVIEGVVLASRKNRLRVAVPGLPDTLELKRSGLGWIADHQRVEIGFLMPSLCGVAAPDLAKPTQQVRAIGFAHTN
jgi:hypothetical protein